MPFTGESIHDWRVAKAIKGRRPTHALGFADWCDEPVVELVKGHNHIRGEGQQGIDPDLVLGRCVTAALTEDIRVSQEAGDYDVALSLADQLDRHERRQKVREVTYAVQRVERRVANLLLFRAVARLHGRLPNIRHPELVALPPGKLLLGPATQKGTISGTKDDPRVEAYRIESRQRIGLDTHERRSASDHAPL
jgi:hypothetical protein